MFAHTLRQGARVGHYLFLVLDELRLHGFEKAHRLGGDDMNQRPTLNPREHGLVDGRAVLRFRQDQTGARPAQSLMRGRSDDVGPLARVRMNARGNQTREVRHIDEQQRAHRVRNLTKTRKIQDAGIRAAAGDDQFGFVLFGEFLQLLIVDALVVFADAVRHHLICLTGKVEVMAVSKVAAV